MTMEPLLEIRNLKKYFNVPQGQLHAVDDISFIINKGETMGIVGESGCGKSTLGRIILRLHEPTAGTIIFDGINITKLDKREMRQMRRHMQIIFQDPYASLNPRLKIAEIIEEPLRLNRIFKSEAELRRRVEELMDLVGLSTRMYNAYPHEFDGGRRQRVVIARALAMNPRFIVCDEPVSALDVSIQAQILNLMIDLQKELGLTYIFISHDLSVVKHICNDVGVMYLGQLVEKAPKKALYDRPRHPYTVALMSAIPSLDPESPPKRHILSGELTSPINPKRGCRFSARCSFAQEACLARDPDFEEIEPGHFVACRRVKELTF